MATNYNRPSAGAWKPKSGGYKGNNDRGGRPSYGGGGSRGGSSYGGGSRKGDTTMHRANCAECNNSCEVPFRPNGRKPVYCSDCFRKDDHKAAAAPRNDRGRDDRRPNYDKPAYHPARSAGGGDGDVAKQLKDLNRKMDQIISALNELSEGEDYVDEDEDSEETLGDNVPGNMEDQIEEDEGDVFTL